jgi:elongator complex protein 4
LSAGGSGENNLAFKCTRKRLIFETLHLDLEGGVGERRTKPPADAPGLDAGLMMHDPATSQETHAFKTASAAVQVQLEGTEMGNPGVATIDSEVKDPAVMVDAKPKKPKKKVVFRSDRPELYDF